MIPRLAAAITSALLLAVPGAAQSLPQAPDQSAIIVTGGKPATREAIRDFVHQLIPVGSGNRLSRFEHSVCPTVFGLPADQRDATVNRMRLVAKTAGAAVGGAKCSPNVVVIVASDKRAVMEELRRRHPDYFGELSGSQIRRLVRSRGPAVAWQLQGPPATADGGDLPQEGTGSYINRTFTPGSRITIPVHPQFAAAIVVVEREALAGLTLTQLADYATIRALTGADPARLGNSGAPTILQVLEIPMGGTVPITMTEWDLAFLRGYYDARRNVSTAAQRSAIAKSMTEELKQPQSN